MFGRFSSCGLILPVDWSISTDVVRDRTCFILKLKQSEKSLFITILRDGGHCLNIRLDVSVTFQNVWILVLTISVSNKQTNNLWTAYKQINVNRYTDLMASVDFRFIKIFRFNATLRITSVHDSRPQKAYCSCFYTLLR
jgi:hypothetical protein